MNAQRLQTFLTAACAVALSTSPATQAAEPSLDFVKDVRPILQKHCFKCHGEKEQKHRLRLDSTTGILRGGESGESLLTPGKPGESYLVKRITSQDEKEVMPPDGAKLSTGEVAVLQAWIQSGAALPDMAAARESLKFKTDHWSFQPVQRPAVPAFPDSQARNGIDAFVLQKLREKSLSLSPPADRATLIRRLYLVMHGMPPTLQETAAFQNDSHPEAWSRMVDRVLASPRYGERWARHWMDVVRYADTNGFETNRQRTTAWHYRDWVIHSLNEDKPYDQFIREQIAGDALEAEEATGFLTAGPYDIVKSPDNNLTAMQRQDELADMVNTTGTAFLGLTMGCARCHNHKFDPILARDYYAMQAVFAGVSYGERALKKKPDPATGQQVTALHSQLAAAEARLEGLRQIASRHPVTAALRPPVNARLNEETFPAEDALSVRFTCLATTGAEPCLDELEIYNEAGVNIAPAGKAHATGTFQGNPIHRLEHINDGKTGNSHSWISNTSGSGQIQIDLPAKTRIQRIHWSRDREGVFQDRLAVNYRIEASPAPEKWHTIASSDQRQPYQGAQDPAAFVVHLPDLEAAEARKLLDESASLKSRIATLTKGENAWLPGFSQPGPTHRLYRGEPAQPREVIAPDALSVIGTLGLGVNEPEQQRRLALANWIASPQNPLTARVIANRLWHYIFGTGLVDTPGDFGANGGRPTHPELLDWMAGELVTHGWSVKHLQRLILLSDTFQQASTPRPDMAVLDSDARFLWRFPPRRLEAEAIRDSMLAVSGALDLKMGGPGFYLMDVVEENVMHYFPKEKYTPAEYRRMVYLFRIRAAQDGVFGSFDCPDGGSIISRRSRSNTPLQALNLFNSSFSVQQAGLLAERLQAEAGPDPAAQTRLAFQLCYARLPDVFEDARSRDFIQLHGSHAFARALYNTSEFLFVF